MNHEPDDMPPAGAVAGRVEFRPKQAQQAQDERYTLRPVFVEGEGLVWLEPGEEEPTVRVLR